MTRAMRIKALDLTPAQAGLLRLIAWQPGQSQQEVARTLGTPPSRLVLLVDRLEERGLIERRRNPTTGATTPCTSPAQEPAS